MKRFLCFVLTVAVLCGCAIPCLAAEREALRFSADGTFTVLNLADTQDDHNPAYDMINLVKMSVAEVQPDLVIISGDIVEDKRVGDVGIDAESGREGVCVYDIAGNLLHDETLANVRATADAIFSIFEEKHIPFAITQGNNDYNSGLTNEEWLDIYDDYSCCLVRDESGDADGKIDCNIEVLSSDGAKTAFNFWLFDVGRGGFNAEQMNWYKTECAAIRNANNGQNVPSIVFQHIETVDIWNLFEPCRLWDEGALANAGKLYRLNRSIASGSYSMVGEIGQTSEQFKAWKEQGDVIGAFFGHEHTEGFSGVWDGIELGFTYGSEFAKTGPHGIRVITLHEDDILNYDNETYTYKGSVSLGTARLELDEAAGYVVYENRFEELLAGFKNAFINIIPIIVSLFRS